MSVLANTGPMTSPILLPTAHALAALPRGEGGARGLGARARGTRGVGSPVAGSREAGEIAAAADELLAAALPLIEQRGITLVGLTVTNLVDADGADQLPLFKPP